MEKLGTLVKLGSKILVGFTAGYTAHVLMEDSIDEKIQEGGIANAGLLESGRTAIAIAAGLIVATILPS